MPIIDNRHSSFSPSQDDTLKQHRIIETPQPELPSIFPVSETGYYPQQTSDRPMTSVLQMRLSDCFEQACDLFPQNIAIICESSRLEYLELDQQANRLAHLLIAHGIDAGSRVGIFLEHSLETYTTLLGILKASATIVPLDTSLSAEQLRFIAKDARIQQIVITSSLHSLTNTFPCEILTLNELHEELTSQPVSRPMSKELLGSSSPCSIAYTSIVAGQLRGVAISHANIINLVQATSSICTIHQQDRVYVDMSTPAISAIEEIWSTWMAGATLVSGVASPLTPENRLAHYLTERTVTVLYTSPSQLATIEHDIASLRIIMLRDRTCTPSLISRWVKPGRKLLSVSGYPETTGKAAWCELSADHPTVSVRPLPSYHFYILDNQFNQVSSGESGEIYIGGPSVATGYLDRPILTKEHFLPHPAQDDSEQVSWLFRTGEVGCLTDEGAVEYLYRVDTQKTVRIPRMKRRELEQAVLAQANIVPLNIYDAVPQILSETLVELEAETPRENLLNRLNIRKMYAHIIADPLYRNSLFNMASTLVLGGLGFGFWILIARLYTTEMVGIATTLISVITLLSNFAIVGLNSSLMRYLPKSTNKNDLINSSFAAVTAVSLCISAVFLLGVRVFSPQLSFLQSSIFYIVSFTVFIVFYSLNNLLESVFMAFRSASNILVKNTIISVMKLVLPFVLIILGAYGIFSSVAFSLLLGVLASLLILVFRMKVRLSFALNISLIRATLSYSFANYLTDFMFNMPSLVLPIIILNVLSAKYVAYYYITSMIQNILLIIPLAASQALLTEGAYDESALRKHVKKAILTILAILIPATIVIALAGNLLLRAFGKSYASEAFQFLQLYSISTLFTAMILVANAIMNVRHRIKLLVVSNIFASLLTLWLSYVFISNKLVGVGWGWTLGQAISGLFAIGLIIYNLDIGKLKRKTTEKHVLP